MSVICENLDMEAFQASFTKTFADLNRARDYQLRQNTRKNFNINDLNPKNLQKVFFWKSLSGITQTYMKIIYDASTLNSGDIIFGLHNSLPNTFATHDPQNTSMNKIYICDLKITKTMIVPIDLTQYSYLYQYILKLIDTNLFDGTYINKHKSIKVPIHFNNSIQYHNLIRSTDNIQLIAKFAACLIWTLHTPQMNKFHSTQFVSRFDPEASVCNFNSSTRLFKSKPTPAKPTPSQPTHIEPTHDADLTTPQPIEPIEPIEPIDIPDDWEDLAL